jgi:hypothetical protein
VQASTKAQAVKREVVAAKTIEDEVVVESAPSSLLRDDELKELDESRCVPAALHPAEASFRPVCVDKAQP